MRKLIRSDRLGAWFVAACCLVALASCSGTSPSARVARTAFLPVPVDPATESTEPRVAPEPDVPQEPVKLSARSLIEITFKNHPDIKSSYHRFKVEEAQYDFFFVSRDALTPKMRFDNSYLRSRSSGEPSEWSSDHAVEFALEKQFFDTTEVEVTTGLTTDIVNGVDGYTPFVSANVRYPLGGSREKLQRASEEIFRRNELDDAQLDYIDKVRSVLGNAMEQFYDVLETRVGVEAQERWLEDLKALRERVAALPGRAADLSRVDASITNVTANLRNSRGWLQIQIERLKTATGLPYAVTLELEEGIYNPFEGQAHEKVRADAGRADPEIATLENAMANARVQLDLALEGNWDIALVAGARALPGGFGEFDGESSWFASAGFEIAKVDARITASLTKQARANILRFARAIEARRREIHVTTLDPIIRIATLTESQKDTLSNLPRYRSDYTNGITQYEDGTLSIDDLLGRRRSLYGEEDEVGEQISNIGQNVAELFVATGKFFELLEKSQNGK